MPGTDPGTYLYKISFEKRIQSLFWREMESVNFLVYIITRGHFLSFFRIPPALISLSFSFFFPLVWASEILQAF